MKYENTKSTELYLRSLAEFLLEMSKKKSFKFLDEDENKNEKRFNTKNQN